MEVSLKKFQITVVASLLSLSIISVYPHEQNIEQSADYGQSAQIATLEDQAVNESSGIAASRRDPAVLWTHNDSGDDAFLYAFNRQGKHLGTYKVKDAKAQDWEDMAAWKDPKSGKSYLYVGDIGDNGKRRPFITVYRVPEPMVAAKDAATTKQTAVETAAAVALTLHYPDGSHHAETLMVHPQTGDLYIVSKVMGATAKVYKLPSPFPQPKEATLVYVADFQVPNTLKGFITGGDISPDGRRVAICDYFGIYELTLPGDKNTTFDEIWKQPLKGVNVTARKQGESVCYSTDGMSLFATSEGTPCPLIDIPRLKSDKAAR